GGAGARNSDETTAATGWSRLHGAGVRTIGWGGRRCYHPGGGECRRGAGWLGGGATWVVAGRRTASPLPGGASARRRGGTSHFAFTTRSVSGRSCQSPNLPATS